MYIVNLNVCELKFGSKISPLGYANDGSRPPTWTSHSVRYPWPLRWTRTYLPRIKCRQWRILVSRAVNASATCSQIWQSLQTSVVKSNSSQMWTVKSFSLSAVMKNKWKICVFQVKWNMEDWWEFLPSATKFAKVMFLQVSVCRGGMSRPTPREEVEGSGLGMSKPTAKGEVEGSRRGCLGLHPGEKLRGLPRGSARREGCLSRGDVYMEDVCPEGVGLGGVYRGGSAQGSVCRGDVCPRGWLPRMDVWTDTPLANAYFYGRYASYWNSLYTLTIFRSER